MERIRPKAILLALGLTIPELCGAQFLHDERRAAKSEETLKAAKEVTSGGVFEKQLTNLDTLSKASSARVFEGAERQMRGRLATFSSRWTSIQQVVEDAAKALDEKAPVDQAVVDAEITRLNDTRKELKTELDELKKKIAGMQGFDSQLIATWLDRFGKIGELEPLAEKAGLIDKPSQAQLALLTEITTTFQSLSELYKNFKTTLPASPSVLLLQSQLDLLKAEETHLKQLGLILARRESELVDLRETLATAQNSLKCVLSGSTTPTTACPLAGKYAALDVRSSLELAVSLSQQSAKAARDTPTAGTREARGAAEKEVRILLGLVLDASSLAARGDTPLRLAKLREAEEERRDSIRQNAAAARSYEQILQNGAERLSLYYQGGIRPDTLARIANALATLGLIPAVSLH